MRQWSILPRVDQKCNHLSIHALTKQNYIATAYTVRVDGRMREVLLALLADLYILERDPIVPQRSRTLYRVPFVIVERGCTRAHCSWNIRICYID